MGSSLGVPGGLGGSLLGQEDSFALKVRSLLLLGVQDPSNQCLLQAREAVMLHMPDSLPAWAAHSEHQEVWAGPSWSSYQQCIEGAQLALTWCPGSIQSVSITMVPRNGPADSFALKGAQLADTWCPGSV
jgi:hypothetical protein